MQFHKNLSRSPIGPTSAGICNLTRAVELHILLITQLLVIFPNCSNSVSEPLPLQQANRLFLNAEFVSISGWCKLLWWWSNAALGFFYRISFITWFFRCFSFKPEQILFFSLLFLAYRSFLVLFQIEIFYSECQWKNCWKASIQLPGLSLKKALSLRYVEKCILLVTTSSS